MLISLVVCTFNRVDILRETLPLVLNLNIPSDLKLELIIVDNKSKDDTASFSKTFIKENKNIIDIHYVFEGNQGLSHARNKGYSKSKGEYVAYIDDECILPKDWLSQAHKIISSQSPAFFGGPYLGKYMSSSRPRWFEESFGDSYILQYNLPDGPMKGRFLSGGNMFIRRDVFEKIGLFDTSLGMSGKVVNYGEELEFQKRYIEAYPDEVIWYDSKVYLWHLIRDEKMTMSFLFKDALIRGKSAAELKRFPKQRLLFSPLVLLLFISKAVISALKHLIVSLFTKQHFFLLLYNDYKNGTWRDIGGAWYKTKLLFSF